MVSRCLPHLPNQLIITLELPNYGKLIFQKMKRIFYLLFVVISIQGFGQTTIIKCGQLIDGKSDQSLGKKAIVIEGNLIKDIIDWEKIPAKATVIASVPPATNVLPKYAI